MKQCSCCGLMQNSFSKDATSKDGLQACCKACRKISSNRHYLANKEKVYATAQRRRSEGRKIAREIKSKNPCVDCGIKYPFYVMQFDHLRDKKFSISSNRESLEDMLQELKKCDLVCANCHAIRTYTRRYG